MSAETFDAAWLTLREDLDHDSRDPALVDLLVEWQRESVDPPGATGDGTAVTRVFTRVLDLGSGTGSNLRYLAPRLPGRQQWLLLDHDAALHAECQLDHLGRADRTVEGADRGHPGDDTGLQSAAPFSLNGR